MTNSEEFIHIVIIDCESLMRTGLRHIVDGHANIKVRGEASNENDGLEIVARQKPDIILLSINSSGSIKVETIRKLLKASSSSRIILVGRPEDTQLHVTAVQEGVLGIVLTTQPPETLIKAIQKVNAGEVWLGRSMIATLISTRSRIEDLAKQDPTTLRIAQLSSRELEVIKQIGQGMKNFQIARQLCLSETTVRHHLTSIYGKLGVTDRLELLVFAHRYGLD